MVVLVTGLLVASLALLVGREGKEKILRELTRRMASAPTPKNTKSEKTENKCGKCMSAVNEALQHPALE